MSLGSLTLLISRECDTYYKTRFKNKKYIALMHCVFHISIVLLKSGAPVRPCDQRCAICRRNAHHTDRRTAEGAGGANRDRTDDLLLAKQALSQLSYGPNKWWVWEESNFRPHPYQGCALTN